MSGAEIKAILGIGNKEEKYNATYHNVGILFLNFLRGSGEWKKQNFFQYQKEKNIIFAKSLTLMNESGLVAKEMLSFFKLKPENLIVVQDDADILLGEYKIQFGRGSAGHKGINSIIQEIKTQKFWRLRIGIREKNSKQKAGNFVLKTIAPEHLTLLIETFTQAKEKLNNLIGFS